MKTKAKKQLELDRARTLLDASKAVVLFDFATIKTADLRKLRQELKASGNPMLIAKKRLLGVLFKERGIDLGDMGGKASVATVFASNLEAAAQSVHKFLKGLIVEKKIEGQKILGGYDVAAKDVLDQKVMVMIGALPPREVLLGQLLGMIAAPIRSFLYLLKEKAARSTS